MAFVPPDTLRGLLRKYYRHHPQNLYEGALNISAKSFLFVRYQCEDGYVFADDIDTMFCSGRQWVKTEPYCVGTGMFFWRQLQFSKIPKCAVFRQKVVVKLIEV